MNTKMPKYVELYSQLRQAILDGEYPVGSFLPTENELMEQYNVSKTTIRHAVKLLRERNMVDVRQGSGTTILPVEEETINVPKYSAPGTFSNLTVRYTTDGPANVTNTKSVIDRVPANAVVAAALGIEPETTIYRMQRIQLVDGIPFAYMVNYMDMQTVPDLESKGTIMKGLYPHLYENYGIQLTDVEEVIDAITAGFMEAQYLRVEVGAPLLLLKRIVKGRDKNGKDVIVEYCETTNRPDTFHMVVKIISTHPNEEEPFWLQLRN